MADDATDRTSPQVVRHWFTEFIHGTVIGMVAVAGIYAGHETSWLGAVSIIVVGAAAVWFAHAYCELMGSWIASGSRSYGRDLLKALRGSWPIVTAGSLLTLPLVAVGLGLWSLDIALLISSLVGVCILGLVGALVGANTRDTWPRRILIVALSCAMGLAVFVVEVIVHH